MKIAIVDEDKALNTSVCEELKKYGYQVSVFPSALKALSYVDDSYSLWVIDLSMQRIQEIQLIEKIKEVSGEIPIIIMSCFGEDFIRKPFQPQDLIIRVNNIMNKKDGLDYEKKTKSDSIKQYYIDEKRRLVYENEVQIELSSREFNLLILMWENQETIVTRELILSQLWGEDYFGSHRVVDDCMRRLRRKMPGLPIEAVYGKGYRLLSESNNL